LKRRQFITLVGGAAAAWPFATRAQQSSNKIPLVGVLWHAGSAEEEDVYLSVLVKAFNDLGYVEGKNIHLEHRFPAENPDRFQTMARELVGLKPDAIGASRREFDWSLADGNRSKWKALGVVKGGGAEAFASCPRR